jgi:hypothetical protein
VTGSTLTLVDNLPLIPAVVGAPHDLSLIPSKHTVFDTEPFFAAQKFWGRLQHRSNRIPAAATPDLRKTSASLWQTPNVTFAHVGTTLQAAEQIAVELYPNKQHGSRIHRLYCICTYRDHTFHQFLAMCIIGVCQMIG